MWKFLLISIVSIELSQAFDIDGWVRKYCIKDKKMDLSVDLKENFFCENPSFTRQELDDIHKGGFVISNSKNIIFKGGDIGLLDEHFLTKFPHCVRLIFEKVNIKLDESLELINHPVESITFTHCEISGIKGSHFFQHLQKLTHLGFIGNKFDQSVLDKGFLGPNPKLISLYFQNNDFAKIDDNAFEGLPNIEALLLSAHLDHVPSHLLSGMSKLKHLNLSGNKLLQVPCESLPNNLEELSLPGNKIQKPSFEGCKFLRSLKRLYLGGNDIETLDNLVFDHLANLEELALDYNKLNSVHDVAFKNLKHLKRINLSGNGIKNSDLRRDISIEL